MRWQKRLQQKNSIRGEFFFHHSRKIFLFKVKINARFLISDLQQKVWRKKTKSKKVLSKLENRL